MADNDKLYPPIIEGIIPAFNGTLLQVPFSMNKAVSLSEVEKIRVRLKGLNSNSEIIAPIDTKAFSSKSASFSDNNFKLLQPGKYYKLQIAYIGFNDQVGHFSQVATVKYTGIPTVMIEEINPKEYIGNYSNPDITEKIYSYRFNVYKLSTGLLFETSGEIIHNNVINENNFNSYRIKADLIPGEDYSIEYVVTTINGLQASAIKTIDNLSASINPIADIKLHAAADLENGCIRFALTNPGGNDISGQFIISRHDGNRWDDLMRFGLHNSSELSKWEWQDFTVEQGKYYQYALQQYNGKGLVSNRILLNDQVASGFEHMYLFDGERQLNIKFNPKVSSFKNDVLEAKQDTIGGKYPFIFRNGSVKYKEFPISGLISTKLNGVKIFNDVEETDSINLTGANIKLERDFKLDVLEWLNNGKPKLFRSATEGNYIVRLLNVSMSPIDTLGRMLHTFTATAYEIAEYTYENLVKYGFIQPEAATMRDLQWKTVFLKDTDIEKNILEASAAAILIEDAQPGSSFRIAQSNRPEYDIVIGDSGRYEISLQDNFEILSVKLINSRAKMGQITYAYWIDYINSGNSYFDSISPGSVQTKQVELIGEADVIKTIEANNTEHFLNFVEIIAVPRVQRSIQVTNINENVSDKIVDTTVLYRIYYVDAVTGVEITLKYIDGNTKQEFSAKDNKIYIDDIPIAVYNEYKLKSPIEITSLSQGNGVQSTIKYQSIQVVSE